MTGRAMRGKAVSPAVARNLSSRDPAKRRAAVEALAGGDERALYTLIKALRDPHPGVQDAAMRSLVSIGGEVSAWMVLPLLRETPFLRNAAMVILKEIGGDALPHLPPLLKDKDDDVRKFAIELLAAAGARDQAGALAERVAGDANPNVRAAAARALGILGCREALPDLVAALQDNEWVRFSALESLAGMGGEAAVEPILPLLSDPSPATRHAAIETLGAIGSPRAGDALLVHRRTAGRDERAAALKSLLRIGVPLSGDNLAGDLLEIFRGEEEWGTRIVALRALAGIADEKALRVIVDIVGSLDPAKPGDEEILLAVKAALRGIGRPDPLRRLLRDPSLRFRAKGIVAEIIGDRAEGEAVPDLVALLQADLRDVRRAVVGALARIGSGEAREALLAAVRDPDGHVRKTAVSALGASGGKEAFEPILSLLREEKYGDVAEEAVLALRAIDSEALLAASGSLEGRARELVERIAGGQAAETGDETSARDGEA